MSRILNLQKLEASTAEVLGALGTMTEGSSCSVGACTTCSTYSEGDCKPTGIVIAL